MSSRERPIDGLWFGLIASLALHALLVPAVIRLSADAGPAGETAPHASKPPLPSDERVRLGLERSDHATINWIGFADPTPHKAIKSDIEQAALSTAPLGRPTEAQAAPSTEQLTEQRSEPAEAKPAAEAQPDQPAEKAAEDATPADPSANVQAEAPPEESPRKASPPTLPTDDPWRRTREPDASTEFLPPPAPIRPDAADPKPTDQPAEATRAEPEPEATPKTQRQPSARPATTPSNTAGPTGADDMPGQVSDRQSTPTAREMAMTLKDWGKPAAGEGIEVMPRRPQWGATVYSLAWPRNPTVIIEFGRDGHVRKASFATVDGRLRNTGSAEVDRILINTLYNWTAKGERISSLTEDGPGSRIVIRMDIKLRW
ncbi:MAG: hypothetical protein H6810_12930 [Phycisphaeraceae bacterium]|nr:MAG: hypothetical protein H6810_12930 [Phycisphaeraceae bacterium]